MKKIMFNDKYGLTQAVLEGRKTMTRRIVPKHILNEVEKYQDEYYNGALETISEKDAIFALCTYEHRFKLPYQVGEVVAIAQNYKDANVTLLDYYNATLGKGKGYSKGYSNKEFVRADLMTHHIRITNVRIEQVGDITNGDALLEGIKSVDPKEQGIARAVYVYGCKDEYEYETPRSAFLGLCCHLRLPQTAWVFVYDFVLVEKGGIK